MEGIQVKAEKIVRQKIRTPDFTPGIKRTETGMHLCVEAPGTFCRLAIYETGKKQGVRIPFSPEERVGDLWMMELAGDDFQDWNTRSRLSRGSCRIRAGASIQDMSAGAI